MKLSNISPSVEQLEIVKAIKNGHNVMCDAVAGSGKTTTILLLAGEMSGIKNYSNNI